MRGGKTQAATKPTAMGTMLQASTYGATIPVIYGTVKSPLLAIWAANVRVGSSGKKGKGAKKGGNPNYIENVDLLLGLNPILGVLQTWNNTTKYNLNLVTLSVTLSNYVPNYTISDARFLAVVGVEFQVGYGLIDFADYLGVPQNDLSGTYWLPGWNEAILGPNPTWGAQPDAWPYVYRWKPSDGATLHFDSCMFTGSGTPCRIHYAQVPTNLDNIMREMFGLPVTPLGLLRLSFENVLGSGSEYSGFESQQIQYPWYAGCGSPNLDLGAAGVLPSLKVEVQGKYAVHPSGDADFVDVIEDMLKQGIVQAAVDAGYGVSPLGPACNAFNFPGCVQARFVNQTYSYRPGASWATQYNTPIAEGNVLVAILSATDMGANTINGVSDDLNGAWTQAVNYHGVFAGGNRAVFYLTNCAAGTPTVTFAFGGGGWYVTALLLELQGVDSFDAQAVGTGRQPLVSVTTTNAPGDKSLILAISIRPGAASGHDLAPNYANLGLWPSLFPVDTSAVMNQSSHGSGFSLQARIVSNPGTYALQWPNLADGLYWGDSILLLLAFKATVPPSYANTLPDFLDSITKELTRAQCRAGGLWGSLSMTAQKPARDWVDELCTAANCAPVWSGFKLKLIPRSEVSALGNGAIYYAPTASGPVADLDVDANDFVVAKGDPPIKIVRKARTDVKTVLQMQHLQRTSDYNQVVTKEPDPTGIALYGVRIADPILNDAVQDVAVARAILRIQVRRQNYVDPLQFQFTLNARHQLLEAMDLVTITDRTLNLVKLPVRLTKVDEGENLDLACEAEPYVWGIHAPQAITVTNPAPFAANTAASGGAVNTPIIFEPVPRLANNQSQLWFVVSAVSPNYGGCQVWISTDGGASYPNLLGTCMGNAITGVTTGDWPAAADPDTTNDLALDLTESLGILESYQVADEDNFTYPCYIAGGTAATPYELMTYALANLTATNKYTLQATGGGTNKLRRAVFAAPGLAGVDHPMGSRWAFLQGGGVLKVAMDPSWIGKTLWFKFPSFNGFGNAQQPLSAATAYTYTPLGTAAGVNPSWQNYTVTPAPCLSQGAGTFVISMAQATAKFPSNSANYNARTFTVPDPGATPATYYVTIADPGMVGDTGSGTSLTATCQTSSALVGVAGNVYLGSITVTHTGGASAVAIQGGMPLASGWLVNGG